MGDLKGKLTIKPLAGGGVPGGHIPTSHTRRVGRFAERTNRNLFTACRTGSASRHSPMFRLMIPFMISVVPP